MGAGGHADRSRFAGTTIPKSLAIFAGAYLGGGDGRFGFPVLLQVGNMRGGRRQARLACAATDRVGRSGQILGGVGVAQMQDV